MREWVELLPRWTSGSLRKKQRGATEFGRRLRKVSELVVCSQCGASMKGIHCRRRVSLGVDRVAAAFAVKSCRTFDVIFGKASLARNGRGVAPTRREKEASLSDVRLSQRCSKACHGAP